MQFSHKLPVRNDPHNHIGFVGIRHTGNDLDGFSDCGRTGWKVYKNGKHGCWNQLPWFNETVDDMNRFFQEHL